MDISRATKMRELQRLAGIYPRDCQRCKKLIQGIQYKFIELGKPNDPISYYCKGCLASVKFKQRFLSIMSVIILILKIIVPFTVFFFTFSMGVQFLRAGEYLLVVVTFLCLPISIWLGDQLILNSKLILPYYYIYDLEEIEIPSVDTMFEKYYIDEEMKNTV